MRYQIRPCAKTPCGSYKLHIPDSQISRANSPDGSDKHSYLLVYAIHNGILADVLRQGRIWYRIGDRRFSLHSSVQRYIRLQKTQPKYRRSERFAS